MPYQNQVNRAMRTSLVINRLVILLNVLRLMSLDPVDLVWKLISEEKGSMIAWYLKGGGLTPSDHPCSFHCDPPTL